MHSWDDVDICLVVLLSFLCVCGVSWWVGGNVTCLSAHGSDSFQRLVFSFHLVSEAESLWFPGYIRLPS